MAEVDRAAESARAARARVVDRHLPCARAIEEAGAASERARCQELGSLIGNDEAGAADCRIVVEHQRPAAGPALHRADLVDAQVARHRGEAGGVAAGAVEKIGPAAMGAGGVAGTEVGRAHENRVAAKAHHALGAGQRGIATLGIDVRGAAEGRVAVVFDAPAEAPRLPCPD